ncbi:MAG: RHS repeat protein [Prevotella sp.]|nr:RHS repeat protein [Prevotella sp.]
MKKNTLLTFILLIFACASLYSQNLTDNLSIVNDSIKSKVRMMASTTSIQDEWTLREPQIVPPHPQARLFNQHINHEISEYNGLADIEIPLYTLELKEMKIPISLSYHSSGIKYLQQDGEVGVGWTLNVGGYNISRTVYGRPDENYPYHNHGVYEKYKNSMDNDVKEELLLRTAIHPQDIHIYEISGRIALTNNLCDNRYDEFVYNIPSRNGHFIIHDRSQSKQGIILDGNNDKVIIDEENNKLLLKNFKIIDDSGTSFHFGERYDEFYAYKNPERRSTYNQPNPYVTWPLLQMETALGESIFFDYKAISDRVKNSGAYTTILDAFIARQASQPGYEIHASQNPYTYTDQFPDESTNALYVTKVESSDIKIEFVRSGVFIKEIFVYDRYNRNKLIRYIKFNYSSNKWHTFLKNVSIGTDATHTGDTYTFDYYTPPAILDENPDSELFPDNWGYYANELFESSYNYTSYSKELFLHKEFLEDKRLMYEWAPDISSPLYKTINQQSSMVSTSKWVDRTNTVSADYFSLKSMTFPTGGITTYEYEPHKYISNNKERIGGGLRIKKIYSSDPATQAFKLTEYKYGKNENGFGVCNYDLSFKDYAEEQIVFCLNRTSETSLGCWTGTWGARLKRTYSIAPISGEGHIFKVQYEQVAKYEVNDLGNTGNGRTVSLYSVHPDYKIEDMIIKSHSKLFNREITPNRHYWPLNFTSRITEYRPGYKPVILERRIFNRDGALKKKQNFSYTDAMSGLYPDRIYKGIKYDKVMSFSPDKGNCNGNVEDYRFINTSIFNDWEYSLIIGSFLPSSKTETEYVDNDSIKVIENYEYNRFNQRIKETIQADDRNISKVYSYLNPDGQYTDDVYRQMIQKNNLQPLLEKTIYSGTEEIGRIKNNYFKDRQKTHNQILLENIQTSTSGKNNLRTHINIDLYDHEGNILQYTQADGVKVSYIWGYHYRYPIAEIKNASYQDVCDALRLDVDKNISSAPYIENSCYDRIISLSEKLPEASISIMKYNASGEMTEFIDPRGKTTYYSYDSYNRLRQIYIIENRQKKILEAYDYNIRNFN